MTRMVVNGKGMVFTNCPQCKTFHGFEEYIFEAAMARRGPNGFSITCPNGHSWHYRSQEQIDEGEKIRLERDRLKQRVAQMQDLASDLREEAARYRKSASARKGQITKMRTRAANGVCPCCSRSFTNLKRHMKTKHPSYTAEEVA